MLDAVLPAELALPPVPGSDRTGDPLAEVAEAIRVERRLQSSSLPSRIHSVDCLDADEGLWRIVVSAGRRRGREVDWRGARLTGDLLAGGWVADVLDHQHGVVLAHIPPPDRPREGAGDLRPFDFLQAPFKLATSPGFRPAHDRYRRLLEAAIGWRTGQQLAPDAGPWGSSWGLLWGPPGTGKTHTLVREVARLLDDPGERVLVVSTTNRATDDVALRLGRHLGSRRALMRRYGLVDPRRYRDEGLLDVVAGADKALALAGLDASMEHSTGDARARAILERRRLLGRLPRLSDALADGEPRCAVTTLHSALRAVVSPAGHDLLCNGAPPFTTVVVDEAGLVPRATAAAVALLASRRVVLVGDPRQLSPICVAARSLQPEVKRWLAVSSLEGADAEQPNTHLLTTQHRMHPDVRRVVSRLSYADRLLDADAVTARPWPAGGRLAHLPRALWLVLDEGNEHGSGAERVERGSWVRPRGLDVFRALLRGYPELRKAEGLFVTPYRAQAEHAAAVVADEGAAWGCSTVHSQQGAEADVVVFDVVKMGGWPPPELRRLVNVALSRARHLVVLLATRRELSARWLEGVEETLSQFVLRRGQLASLDTGSQEGLFAAKSTPAPARSTPRDPSPPTWTGPVPDGRRAAERPPPLDPSRLGPQIRGRRAGRRTLTRQQEQLISRDLKDLGPRLVRGVAGSGKTIVLARWAAVELAEYPSRTATVLFGNHSLQPHLDDLLRRSWRVVAPTEPYPEDRVRLLHIGRLLWDLAKEHGLRPAVERWDYEGLATLLADVPARPRFDLLYIDEAQDFGHEVLERVLSLVDRRDGFPVRIFYDNAQNVYERSMPVWSSFGLDVRGRSAVLRENFRTTREATELALNVLHRVAPLNEDKDLAELQAMDPPLLYRDDGGRWRADFCVASGQAAEVEVWDDRDAEERATAEAARRWMDDGVAARDIRVLAVGDERCGRLVERLTERGVPAAQRRGRDFDPREDRVLVTTPQGFKGYEAEIVAVCGLDAFAGHGKGVWTSLIWVALTRAQTLLRVSASRVRPGHPAEELVRALEEEAGRG